MFTLLQKYAGRQILCQWMPYFLLGMLVGTLLVFLPPLYACVAPAGIMLLFVCIKKPEYGILALVMLSSSIIFEEKLPLLPIGIGSFLVQDVLLLLLLGLAAHRVFADYDGRFAKSPLNMALGIFMLSAVISVIISIFYYHLDYNFVMRRFRDVSYYLLFFSVTNLITDKKQIQTLVKGLFVIAMIVAVAMLIQSIVGESVQLMPGRVEVASTFGEEFDATRILPPGQTLLFVLFVTAICFVTFDKNRCILMSGHFYMLMILGIGIVLTYNRNYWLAAFGVIIILFLRIPSANKLRLVSLMILVTVLSGSTVAFLGSTGMAGETREAVYKRFTSLFAGTELTHSASLEGRYLENEYAIRHIKEHPVLGIGLGNSYRPNIFGPDDELTYYIHNGYLWILTDMGFVGFLFFMWFYSGFILRGLKSWKLIKDDFFKSAMTGFTLSGLGILPMVFVNPVFMQSFSIVVLSLIAGLTETIIRIDGIKQEP